MFVVNLFIPIIISYLAWLPYTRKNGMDIFKKLKVHLTALGTFAFVTVVQMILYTDFLAVLDFSYWKTATALIVSIFFTFIEHGAIYLHKKGSLLAAAAVFFSAALFLELTVFNFRFYQTADYEAIDVTEEASLSFEDEKIDGTDNVYEIENTYATIRIYDINKKIHNIYLDITARDEYNNVENMYAEVSFTDESNTQTFLSAPEHTVMSRVESTKYLHLLTNGNTSDVYITLTTDYAKTYQVDGIALNVSVPFNFSIIRLAAVFVLLLIFWVLRPASKLWKHTYNRKSLNQLAVTFVVVFLTVLLLFGISFINPVFHGNPSSHTRQYQQLAESFLDGKLYLETEPPQYLAELENPYDYGARSIAAAENEESYYWDAAYYEGRYYVYFGVVPVLLLYLPFRAITGEALPNMAAINVFMVFFVIGAFLLIGKIIDRYFKNKKIPYLAYLILSLIFVNASCGIFIAKRPDFYSVPILSAIAFTVWGLYLWISSVDEGRVNWLKAGIGSLCMALVAGCRPQLLLVSAMAIVIFWNSVFKERSLFSKKGIASTLSVCIPYIIVALGIMWYNNARFGSPFDFGANYNLTTNDMTGRGYRVERVGLSLFTYLLQPPNITGRFPFLRSVNIDTGYLGQTITEPMFGGIFAVIPLLWLIFLIPRYSKYMKKQKVFALACLPVALSIFIAAFDAQGAGLLQRYVNDFSFLAILGAVIVAMTLLSVNRTSRSIGIRAFLRFALFGSGAYCAMIIFAKYSVEIYYKNPYFFNKVAELVEFW